MRARSSLAEAQREAAVALFEKGIGYRSAAHLLGVLLDVAGLARSTFFYHQARIQAPDPKEKLKAAVTEIFTRNDGR